MGLLVDGTWQDQWYDTKATGGAFKRTEAQFRNWITSDGAPGPSGTGGFAPESGRYHLYVSHACPWAHRTMIFRTLKGLEPHIGVSVVHPFMGAQGWSLSPDHDGATGDLLHGAEHLHQIYTRVDLGITTRVTVPILWDRQGETIVSNESSEIIRMLNGAFNALTGDAQDFYPAPLRDEIDAVNARIYTAVNNGVYKSGFATTQAAYDEAVAALFDELDRLEAHLARNRYLVGDRVTEADWRLFTTLVRFDAVYVGHFKCNRRRLVDYPALQDYARELYQWPGVAQTVNMDHIRYHYHASHESINPHRIVPVGPVLDFDRPHGRGALAAA